jgi:alkyl hydroperoxide reductase subunit AhpC
MPHFGIARRQTHFERGKSELSTEPRIPRILEPTPDFKVKSTHGIIQFPVVADLDQKVSQTYGLVHEAVSDTATVRAVFAIDPKQNIRAIVYYPMQLGRKVEKLVRVFQALRSVDDNAVSAPANWKPDEPMTVPAPATLEVRVSGLTVAELG